MGREAVGTKGKLLCFAACAGALFLEYLRCHNALGVPVRIPATFGAWTPAPTRTRLTAAAARSFREQVEAAARATAPFRKRGGVTYAGEVRRLFEAVEIVLRTPASAGSLTIEDWKVSLSWWDGAAVLQLPGETEVPAARPGSVPGGAVPTSVTLARRSVLGLLAGSPGALGLGRHDARVQGGGASSQRSPPVAIVPPADRLGDCLSELASALNDLGGWPLRDWDHHGRSSAAFAPHSLFPPAGFETAGILARRLMATMTTPQPDAWLRGACVRDLGHADRARHVLYHVSSAERLLARLRAHAVAGTHWWSRYAGKPWTWDGLVSSAMFDLRNFAADLLGREDCIRAAGDPFTFTHEIQVVAAPFLIRKTELGLPLISPTLCARVMPDPSTSPSSAMPWPVATSFVWLLDEPNASRRARR